MTIIENPKRMTWNEILDEYSGKWVFLVDLIDGSSGFFETAVPVVVSDNAWDGSETGIYHELEQKHERTMPIRLLFSGRVGTMTEIIEDEEMNI